MNEYENIIDFNDVQARSTTIGAIDADPERAATSIDLSRSTGVPADAIYTDFEGFEQKHKAQLATDLVKGNTRLANYMTKSPMNARLSIDDLANLDAVSVGIDKLGTKGIFERTANAFKEGYNLDQQMEEIGKLYKFIDHPLWGAFVSNTIVGQSMVAADVGARLFNAGLYAVSEFGGAAAGAALGDEAEGRKLTRDIYQIAQVGMSGMAGPGAGMFKQPAFKEMVKPIADVARAAEPYLLAGKEPPAGLHPMIDEAKLEQSKIDLKNLEKLDKEADKSFTRDKVPVNFADYVRDHGDASIYVAAESLERLAPLAEKGDIAGLAEQLQLAADTGGDVQIKLSDWLTYIDPELKKELYDDVRVRSGGITVNEGKLKTDAEPSMPRPSDPVEAVRAAAGLEPLFAIGDRKLELAAKDKYPFKAVNGEDRTVHTFDIMDDKGKNVGIVDLTEMNGGKTLYIENIAADWRLGPSPNSWGPSLIRDVLRQIKDTFPNAEELSGFRVSGAREKAGLAGKAKIKLGAGWDTAETANEFSQLLKDGGWEPINPRLEVYNVPYEKMSPEQKALTDSIVEVFDRLTPKGIEVQTPLSIRRPDFKGSTYGFFQEYKNYAPVIAVALDSMDAAGFARHEAIHALKRGKYLTQQEWNTLQKAALDNKWIEEFDINSRYKDNKPLEKLEEAVAEGFRKWADGKEAPKELHPIFEKIKALFDGIKEKLKELFGHEPTWEEIFGKVESGEVAKREGLFDRGLFNDEGVAMAQGPAQPELGTALTRMEDRQAFDRASALGINVDTYKRYQKAIEERQNAEYEKQLAKAEREQKRRQSAEWKAEAATLRPEVAADIQNRPDIAADSFLRDGRLYGDQVAKVRLNSEYLTPEQQAGLSRNYYAKTGAHPDDIAGLFGFDTGKEMVDRLVNIEAERQAMGGQRADFVRKIIDAEVERKMEQRHGRLDENILEAAKEEALSKASLRVLDEEVIMLAEMAKAELPIKGSDLITQVKDQFAKAPVDSINSDKFLATIGKMNKLIEDALLRGKPEEAFVFAQRKRLAAIAAKEAVELEKDQAKFGKLAKRYSTNELPKGADHEYSYYVMDLLSQAEYPLRVSPQQIAEGKAHYGDKPLGQFVADSSSYGWEPAVVDDIIANGAKSKEAMSVGEWREFNDAVTSLDFISRQINKIDLAGEKADFGEFKADVKEHLQKRPLRDVEQMRNGGKWLYNIDASWTRMEEIIKDLDFRKDFGPMFKAVIVPYEASKNKANTMLNDLTKKLKAIDGFDKEWQKTLAEELPGDFVLDPESRTPVKLNRWNMLKMMLNFGAEENKVKLAQGLGSSEAGKILKRSEIGPMMNKIDQFVHQHATPVDWKFVQEIWKVFDEFRPQLDTLQRNTSGVVPKWVDPITVTTKFGDMEGGYFPLIPDKLYQLPGQEIGFSGDAPSGKGPLTKDYFRASTPKGHMKERTGKPYFVDISGNVEQLAGRMQQVIHDIAYRDFVIQAGKVLYDPQIQNSIKRYYGTEYQAEMIPWLKRIANELNAPEHAVAGWDKAYRELRLNLTASVLPLNYTVMFSPSTGTLNPKVIASYLSDRTRNREMVMQHSKELQHTLYSLDRDISASLKDYVGRQGLSEFRAKAVETMFKGLVKVEQQTRKLTFYEKFMEAKAKGMSDTDAASLGDSAIRERHGATGVGDLPSMMAKQNEFARLSTLFMGYFTMQRNWMRQLPHQAREAVGGETPEIRSMNAGKFAETFWGTIGIAAMFNTLLFTKQKEDEPVFKWLARALITVPTAMVPGVREGMSLLLEGRGGTSPIAGVMDAVYKAGKDGYDAYGGKTVKKPVAHAANVAGLALGVPGSLQVGRTAGGLYDVARGTQRPRDITEWFRLVLTGEAKKRKK